MLIYLITASALGHIVLFISRAGGLKGDRRTDHTMRFLASEMKCVLMSVPNNSPKQQPRVVPEKRDYLLN